MNTRMDKYENDTPELKKRTERNQDLYRNYELDNYNKFDVNSNISVLKDNAKAIDVDQIKDMLDKKYRDNIPKRKSISIEEDTEPESEILKEDTKEYDLNSILSKARQEKNIDYEVERLNRAYSGRDLVDKVNEKYSAKEKEALEITSLMNTITELELKNQRKDAELLDLADEDDDKSESSEVKVETPEKEEEEFYTGKLRVTEEDYDDFKDMQEDIRSNSVLIKILVFIFIIVLIGIAVVVANNIFKWGLF